MKPLHYLTLFTFVFLSFVSQAVFSAELIGTVSVTGFGTVDPSKTVNSFQAKMMAKRAAQLDAQRQLAERIKGIELSAGTTVEDFEVTSDVVATRVKSLLKGAFVLDEKVVPEEDSYVAEVTMAICLTNEAPVCRSKDSIESIGKSLNASK